MRVFFLDTNLFLQCRDITELPWSNVSENEELLLLIARPVQDEIDRLKQDGNSRRAKRARKASSYIRKILLEKDSQLTIKSSMPQIIIAFSPAIDIPQDIPKILDLSRADDKIIAEAIAYKKTYLSDNVAILTHDTNPILTAKRCNLNYEIIPDDWLLAPEPDTRDKNIKMLKQRVQELEKSYPQIEISARNSTNDVIKENLALSITCYEELPEFDLNNLVKCVKAKHPMIMNFKNTDGFSKDIRLKGMASPHRMFGLTHTYEPPSDEEINEYKRKHPQWLESVESSFKFLHHKLMISTYHIELSIDITNIGSFPAENTKVEFKLVGDLLFEKPLGSDEKSEDSLPFELPQPPKAPTGTWIKKQNIYDRMNDSIFSNMQRLSGIDYNPKLFEHTDTDRNAFYWKPKPFERTHMWTFECEEFIHQGEPERFHLSIHVPISQKVDNGALICRVSARNLSRPKEYILPISITYEKGNIIEQAEKLLCLGSDL